MVVSAHALTDASELLWQVDASVTTVHVIVAHEQ